MKPWEGKAPLIAADLQIDQLQCLRFCQAPIQIPLTILGEFYCQVDSGFQPPQNVLDIDRNYPASPELRS